MSEYALIIGLVAIAVIVALTGLSGKLTGVFNKIANALPASTTTTP